jgi:hypothetical protein
MSGEWPLLDVMILTYRAVRVMLRATTLHLRFAGETGQSLEDLLSVGLDQPDLAVEIGFFLRMEL